MLKKGPLILIFYYNFCSNVLNFRFHLVDFKANLNSLNTMHDGTGRLQVRITKDENLKDIKEQIENMGMKLRPHQKKNEIKRF